MQFRYVRGRGPFAAWCAHGRSPKLPAATMESGRGAPNAELAAMFERLYGRLQARAGALLAGERRGHTLEPSALLHEVYVRLEGTAGLEWRSATHFEALTARVMRQVLVDHAKAATRQKRGGGATRVTLAETLVAGEPGLEIEILALHEALDRLAEEDPRAAGVLELRLFSSMTVREVATALELSYDEAKNDWLFARAWIARELRR